MELNNYDKIDMSLDEIIHLERMQKRRQLSNSTRPRQYYSPRNSARRFQSYYWPRNNVQKYYSSTNKRYPLMLFTRKWRQLQALKSIKRAKFVLHQQRRRWSRAYKIWEANAQVTNNAGMYSDQEWDDNSVWQATTNRQPNEHYMLKPQRSWSERENKTPIHGNLTVSLHNNLINKDRYYGRKSNPQKSGAMSGPLLLGPKSLRGASDLSTATMKARGIEGFRPIVCHTTKSLHERFSRSRSAAMMIT